MADQACHGMALMETDWPVRLVMMVNENPAINICNPKPKYGLNFVACCFVYKLAKAHVQVAIKDKMIPKRKSGIRKSFQMRKKYDAYTTKPKK